GGQFERTVLRASDIRASGELWLGSSKTMDRKWRILTTPRGALCARRNARALREHVAAGRGAGVEATRTPLPAHGGLSFCRRDGCRTPVRGGRNNGIVGLLVKRPPGTMY